MMLLFQNTCSTFPDVFGHSQEFAMMLFNWSQPVQYVAHLPLVLLMAEILLQLIGSLSHN